MGKGGEDEKAMEAKEKAEAVTVEIARMWAIAKAK